MKSTFCSIFPFRSIWRTCMYICPFINNGQWKLKFIHRKGPHIKRTKHFQWIDLDFKLLEITRHYQTFFNMTSECLLMRLWKAVENYKVMIFWTCCCQKFQGVWHAHSGIFSSQKSQNIVLLLMLFLKWFFNVEEDARRAADFFKI